MREEIAAILITLSVFGCAQFGGNHLAVRPLIFEREPVQEETIVRASVRLIEPRPELPSGGALVQVGTRVLNPNNFAVTVQTITGTLYMDERKVGTQISGPVVL